MSMKPFKVVWMPVLLVVVVLVFPACKSMMMRMMGMGDMVVAMKNMNHAMTEKDPDTGEVHQKAGGDVMKMMMKMKPMMMEAKKKAIARGRQHFNDPEFAHGKKGVSCNSCHPGGRSSHEFVESPMPLADGNPARMPVPSLMGAAGTFPKYKVPSGAVVTVSTMSNNCIRMFMKGKRLDHNSQEMRDLVAYLHTLKKG